MLDESNNPTMETSSAPPPEEAGNRTFLIVGGIFAALILLTLLCGAIYVLWLGPRLTAQRNAVAQGTSTANALAIQQETSTAQVALWTPTLPPTLTPTKTPVPQAPMNSPTSVLALSVFSPTPTATTNPATLVVMQTQLSQQMTSTAVAKATLAVSGQGMPATGFFDQVGLPSLIVLAAALVIAIFLARRLRKGPAK